MVQMISTSISPCLHHGQGTGQGAPCCPSLVVGLFLIFSCTNGAAFHWHMNGRVPMTLPNLDTFPFSVICQILLHLPLKGVSWIW